MQAHGEGGEADKGGCRGAGIGASGARRVGEHVVESLMLAYMSMGGKGGGRVGRCELRAHGEGGEADKGGHRWAGIGAPGARHVGEYVVVRALEGDAPLFVAADFFITLYSKSK